MSPAIPLHLVTGFLGAGKTSFINRMLRAPELADTLVIVNEWGEIGLDHLLYETLAEDAILLSSGCLCCDLRGDLIEGLRDILRRRDAGELTRFARVVLETSGLADPAPILHALFADAELSRRVRLAGVTTLVDSVNGLATLEAHGEARRQVALADRLIVSKTDLTPLSLELAAALARLQPHAAPLDGEIDPGAFLAELPLAAPRRVSAMSAHGASARTRAFVGDGLVEEAALERFLTVLGQRLGPELLRIKGLVGTREAPERPWLIQGAQHAFSPPRRLPAWPGADRKTFLVVISDGLAAEEVERLWLALTGAAEIDRPDLAAMLDNPLAPRRGGLLG